MNEATYRKRTYIEWFLNKNKLQRPDTVEILKLLLNETSLLQVTRFVEDVDYWPNAIIISAEGTDSIPFFCRLNGNYYYDVAEILAVLINDPPPDILLWIVFNKDSLYSSWPDNLQIKELEFELNRSMFLREEKKSRLMEKIDAALEERCEEKFFYWVQRYKNLFE